MTSLLCHLMRAVVAAGRGKGGKQTFPASAKICPVPKQADVQTFDLPPGIQDGLKRQPVRQKSEHQAQSPNSAATAVK
jgi:hypothetical protein